MSVKNKLYKSYIRTKNYYYLSYFYALSKWTKTTLTLKYK